VALECMHSPVAIPGGVHSTQYWCSHRPVFCMQQVLQLRREILRCCVLHLCLCSLVAVL
jgi:hypothetical protein